MGPLFFCVLPPGAGSFHYQLDIVLNQPLETPVIRLGLLQIGHLIGGEIAPDIAPLLIALVIVTGSFWPWADDTDSAAVQVPDLGDLLED